MTGGPVLPNFFIAGAPKSGSTSLYHYLAQHPEIYMSPIKEPNYFASEIRMERFSERLRPRAEKDAQLLRAYLDGPMLTYRFGGLVTEWNDYLKLFLEAGERKAIGEASVSYLWSQSAAANIRRTIPDARIILVLRNPVEMIFSMYLHTVRSGAARGTFHETIETALQRQSDEIDVLHPFLDFGFYAEQVKRYLDSFPERQVRIFWYEDYHSDPAGMLEDVFSFLGANTDFRPDMSKRYLEGARPDVVLEAADRAFLADFYRDDIAKLAELLRRDLSSWT